MSANFILIFALPLCFLITGCTQDSLSYEEYLEYLSNPSNGLRGDRQTESLVVSTTLLPASFRKYRLPNPASADSTIGFQVAIKFDENSRQDVSKDVAIHGVHSVDEFLARIEQLNFSMEQDLTMKCSNKQYKCVLAAMDNSYGLSSERRFTIVFVPDKHEDPDFFGSEEIELIYHDRIFGIGKQKFSFTRSSYDEAPELRNDS